MSSCLTVCLILQTVVDEFSERLTWQFVTAIVSDCMSDWSVRLRVASAPPARLGAGLFGMPRISRRWVERLAAGIGAAGDYSSE